MENPSRKKFPASVSHRFFWISITLKIKFHLLIVSYRIPQVLDPAPHFDWNSHQTFLQIPTMIYIVILDCIHSWASRDSHLTISAASQLQGHTLRPSQTNQFKFSRHLCTSFLPQSALLFNWLFRIHILQLESKRVGPFSLQHPRTWNP